VWKKPSFGLFDFSESNKLVSSTHYVLTESGYFLLNSESDTVTEVKAFGKNPTTEALLKVKVNMTDFQIVDLNHGLTISDCLWVRIKRPFEYKLSVGDVLRLGKQKIIVSDIHFSESDPELQGPILTELTGNKNDIFKSQGLETNPSQAFDERKPLPFDIERQAKFASGLLCRVCLEEENIDDPFVDLCECSKSMPMHLNCVIEWLRKKCEVNRRQDVVYCNLANVRCELCKTEYPTSVKFHGKTVMLFSASIDRNRSYIIFDICNRTNGEKTGFVIIYFDSNKKAKYSIGRSEKNDITFDDVSVSREHAELICDRTSIKIVDLDSRFGTMLRSSVFNYNPRKDLFFIQVDKFLFEFHVFQGTNCFCNLSSKFKPIFNPFRRILHMEVDLTPPPLPNVLHDSNSPQINDQIKHEEEGERRFMIPLKPPHEPNNPIKVPLSEFETNNQKDRQLSLGPLVDQNGVQANFISAVNERQNNSLLMAKANISQVIKIEEVTPKLQTVSTKEVLDTPQIQIQNLNNSDLRILHNHNEGDFSINENFFTQNSRLNRSQHGEDPSFLRDNYIGRIAKDNELNPNNFRVIRTSANLDRRNLGESLNLSQLNFDKKDESRSIFIHDDSRLVLFPDNEVRNSIIVQQAGSARNIPSHINIPQRISHDSRRITVMNNSIFNERSRLSFRNDFEENFSFN